MDKHKHHIVPRHKGGTNDHTNLIEVTVTQHAMFHYCEWKLHGNEYDRIAWKALSNQITLNEAQKLAQLQGCKNGGKFLDKEFKILGGKTQPKKYKILGGKKEVNLVMNKVKECFLYQRNRKEKYATKHLTKDGYVLKLDSSQLYLE